MIDVAEDVAEAAPAAPAVEPEVEPVPVPKEPRLPKLLPVIAMGLAAVASFMAVVGLVVTSRTVAEASLVVADARERQEQLAEVSALVEELKDTRRREEAALARIRALRSGQAVTLAEVNHAIDDLKADLERHSPEDGALSLVRAGQSELADRLGQITLKVERIEDKLNAIRPAKTAAGRAPTS